MVDTVPRRSLQHHSRSEHGPRLLKFETDPSLQSISSQPQTLGQFLDAKADFLTMVQEAKAVEGIINGREMEDELVSGQKFTAFYI